MVIVLVVAAILAIWYFGHIYVAMAVFKLRYLEILLISYVFEVYTPIARDVGLPIPNTDSLVQALNIIQEGPSSTMSFSPSLR